MSIQSLSPRSQIEQHLFSQITPRINHPSSQNLTLEQQQYLDNFKPFQKLPVLLKQEQIKNECHENINENVYYLDENELPKSHIGSAITQKVGRNIFQIIKINNLVKRFKNTLLCRSYVLSQSQKEKIKSNLIFQEKYLQDKKQNSKNIISFVIDPTNKYIILWDIIMFFVILSLIILIPFFWSFDRSYPILQIEELTLFLTLLCLDIILKLNIAIIKKGNIIKTRKFIVKKYLQTSFILDIIFILLVYYTIQIESILIFISYCAFSLIKLQKIIAKIVKLLNLSAMQREIISLINLVITINLIAHFMACIWHYIGMTTIENEKNSWILYKNLQDDTKQVRYIFSFYWAIVTMITVGYGDITPQNHIEAFSCIFLMLLSCAVFTFSLNQVGTIVQNINKQKRQFQEMVRILTSYMQQHSIPDQLQSRARSYLEYRCIKRNQQSKYHLQNILEQLSSFLQQELMLNVFKNLLQDCKIISHNFSEETIKKMSNSLQTAYYCPDEQIYFQNQIDDNYLYFLDYGKVELQEKKSLQKVTELQKGKYFGEESFFTQQPRKFSAISRSFTKVFRISQNTFLNLLNKEELQVYHQLRHLIQFNSSVLGQKCQICSQCDHQIDNCQLLNYKPDIEKLILKDNLKIQYREKKQRLNKRSCKALQIQNQLILMQKVIAQSYGQEEILYDDEENGSLIPQDLEFNTNQDSPISKRKESLPKQTDSSPRADIKNSHDSNKRITFIKSDGFTRSKQFQTPQQQKQTSETDNKTQQYQNSVYCKQQMVGFEKAMEFKKFFPQFNLHVLILEYNKKVKILNKTQKMDQQKKRGALNIFNYNDNNIIFNNYNMDFETQIIICKNNAKSVVDKRLRGFVQVWDQIFDEDEEIIDFEADPQLLQKINHYYQFHEYDKTQISYVEKIQDSKIEHLMDQKSLEYLKFLGFKNDELSKERVQEWLTEITPLLCECYRLNCVEIIEILKISVAIFFYIEGLTEKEFQQFALKWGVMYPLPPQIQRKIVEENKFVFDRQGKK
ncbi:unnamed protein product [Paramecium sonneborni]|uniref:Cyclic nucleotide-binding domain-containing protein n=1 Tax=Paramecium sonneborni TaxID=65129 RepID=A0A8S1Q6Y1_9CILI|nr:unnamed protein product [Paramecium sonneborni]